ELEQLSCHLQDCRTSAIPLLRPAPAPQLVQPWWRGICTVMLRCTIALDLVYPVQRNVQPVAALILDYRHFHGSLAHEDALDTAINANAMLQVHHVVTGLEAGDGFE